MSIVNPELITVQAANVSVAAETYLDSTNVQDALSVDSHNLRGWVIIDMGDDDYTMTLEQASAGKMAIVNSGDGTKTLTNPTIADTHTPIVQLIVMGFASNKITYASESNIAVQREIPVSTIDYLAYIPGVGIFSMSEGLIDYAAVGFGWSSQGTRSGTQAAIYNYLSKNLPSQFLLMGA